MREKIVKYKFKALLKNTEFKIHANAACAGSEAGWPDLDIIWGPYTLRVECKGKGGKLSPHQQSLLPYLDMQGIPVALLTVTESHLFIQTYPKGSPYMITTSDGLVRWIKNVIRTATKNTKYHL
jgi:hypothetical protein